MIYVDASAVVPLLTVEPETQAVTGWFAGVRDTPVSSDWLLSEFSSALPIKLRAGQINEANARKVRKEFELLADGGMRVVPVSRAAFKRAAELARMHSRGLHSGDSLHLAVALELGASHMATLDLALAANAKRHGIELIEF